MSLKHLKLEPDIIEGEDFLPPKEKTPFERRRAQAQTYHELVELGYEEGMEFPEAWADHVMRGRQRHAHG